MDYKKLYLNLIDRVKQLNKIGLALSTEKNTDKLFEMILDESTKISNAAGSTLYQSKNNKLFFSIIKNEPLNIWQGGISGNEINFPPIKLNLENGDKNLLNVCAYSAITGDAVNIKDAYKIKQFDFSGMKKFDKATGFKSQSSLTVPMKDHESETIGVIQLFNARDENGNVISFSEEVIEEIESLASQGAISLSNKKLVEDLQEIFESFIKLIALAIDRKSEYTGGHCQRVPELTMMLAEALERQTTGKFKDFKMTDDEKYELKIAAWLHDCGKVTTPVHVVDKSTKLETIFDRIELIKTRFQSVKDQRKIEFLSDKILLLESGNISELNKITKTYNLDISELNSDLDLIVKFNLGAEFMPIKIQNKIKEIGKKIWIENGIKKPLLTQNEIENLTISKGTLNPAEREEINNHIVVTLEMLNNLPYPKHLKKVPEFAGGHHEKIDGTGYPMGLTGNEMSTQAKVMAVADIYEALTAKDRPYKKGKKLSESMRILGFMKNDYHIDKDIFEIFVKEKVYKQYADLYVAEDQHDTVNELELIN